MAMRTTPMPRGRPPRPRRRRQRRSCSRRRRKTSVVTGEDVRKVAGVKKGGGEVVLAGRTSDDRQRRAEAIAAREGLAIVPPFDHPDIVAGQATVGLEIAEQLADVRTVVVPVGGGGLIAGVVTG